MRERTLRVLFIAALLILSAERVAVAAQQCIGDKILLTEFGQHYKIGKRLSPNSPHIPINLAPPGVQVRYVRILIKPNAVRQGWKLVIRDQRLRPLQVIDARNFSTGSATVWSDRLPTSAVDLSLILDNDMPDFFVDIPAADAMPEKAERPYYSIKGDEPDWSELYSPDFGLVPPETRSLGDSVGMLTAFTGSSITGVATWCCSGFIVATEPSVLFLTNYHCGGLPTWGKDKVWKGDVCANTIIDMSWDDDRVSMEYVCKSVKKTDDQLDLAVLEIIPMSLGGTSVRSVKIRTAPLIKGEPLQMVHQPQCLPKKISRGCVGGDPAPNWRKPELKTDFTHRCDSEGGSSGAPMFDANGNLVGVHHLGYQLSSATGRCDDVNKAISAVQLLEFLSDISGSTENTPD